MKKRLKFNAEARQGLLAGVEKIAKAVKCTLGPAGRNVVIDRKYGAPAVTKDGVTVAREVALEDPWENMGARLVREVSAKTNDVAGDGTTTATVLAEAIYREGLRNVEAGANPTALRRGIDKAAIAAAEELRRISKPVETPAEIAQVATVSANWDGDIGGIVAEAMERVGKDGTVAVEEAKGMETELDVVEGMQFDKGYLSPYFATDTESMEAVLEEPLILVHDRRVSKLKDVVPLLEEVAKSGRQLLVLAEDVDGEALAALVVNRLRGTFRSAAVKAPGYGDRRKAMLQDIAVLTGAQCISEDVGLKLENAGVKHLGSAERVVVTKDSTTIIGGRGSQEAIAARVSQIRKEIEDSQSEYDREKLRERLAKLAGGVAVIKVGAATETEMKEKKDRVDDALHATRAAVEEGIVPGGGVALIRAQKAIDGLKLAGDEATGANIVSRAMEAPLRQLVENAGCEAALVVERVKGLESPNMGYDVAAGEYGDMLAAGIADPTKVTRSALLNAASIAGLMLTTECIVAEVPEPEDAPKQPNPGM